MHECFPLNERKSFILHINLDRFFNFFDFVFHFPMYVMGPYRTGPKTNTILIKQSVLMSINEYLISLQLLSNWLPASGNTYLGHP